MLKKKLAAYGIAAGLALGELGMACLPAYAIGLEDYGRQGEAGDNNGGYNSQSSSEGTTAVIENVITDDGGDGSKEEYNSGLGSGQDSYTTDNGNPTYQVSLSERYNRDYDTYEESIDNMFYFYSNVANGSFTYKPVNFDIPANISYTLEKDGAPANYTAGSDISALGNYVLRLTAVYENRTYIASFRFTIREMSEAQRQEEEAEAERLAQEQEALAQQQALEEQQAESGDTQEITEASLQEPTEEQIDQGALETIIDTQGTSSTTSVFDGSFDAQAYPASQYTGLMETYDYAFFDYQETLLNQMIVKISIPNGGITNQDVTYQLPAGLEATIYRDGALYEDDDFRLEESGYYIMKLSSSDVSYISNYNLDQPPYIVFRIVKAPVNDLRVVNAPYGMEIASISKNGEMIMDADYSDEDETVPLRYYEMEEDGKYSFVIKDVDRTYQYEFSVERDLTPPDCDISIDNGVAEVSFNVDELSQVALYKNGVIQTDFDVNKIKGKGDYIYQLYDKAGNMSEFYFSLKSSVNAGNVIAIVVMLGLVGGGVYLYMSSKKSFTVR